MGYNVSEVRSNHEHPPEFLAGWMLLRLTRLGLLVFERDPPLKLRA